MCGCNIGRRTLGKLLAGAAGAGLLPTGAQAATVTALAITCIDYWPRPIPTWQASFI